MSSDQPGAAPARQIQAKHACVLPEERFCEPPLHAHILGETLFRAASSAQSQAEPCQLCRQLRLTLVSTELETCPDYASAPPIPDLRGLELNGEIMSKYIPGDCSGRGINEPLSFPPEQQREVPASHFSPPKPSFWVDANPATCEPDAQPQINAGPGEPFTELPTASLRADHAPYRRRR